MTTPKVELFFDYSCPYAYLASTQIGALCGRHGAELIWRPMLLGGVFRAVDTPQNLSEVLHPSKARHNFADMHRWASVWGVPFRMHPRHPVRTVEALRATLAAPAERRADVIHRLYRMYWVDSGALDDRAAVASALAELGLDGEALAGPFDQAVKDELRSNTDEAVSRGVFGAPAAFFGGELFWGQDRLWMLADALTAAGYPAKDAVPSAIGPVPGTPGGGVPGAGKTVDFWYDFSSPFTYLASAEIEAVCARHGATLRWRPMLLGGVFKALGGPMVPMSTFSKAKRDWIARDMRRWAEHWQVDFRWPSRFPMVTVRPLRLAIALDNPAPLIHRIFRAFWAEDRDISDPAVLAELLADAGHDPAAVEETDAPEVKQALIDQTAEATNLGVFGAPTFVVDGRLYWGQDRLGLLERALEGWEPPL
jgi:2-hydroxychromene-2-carboxylate isomerase